MKIRKGNSIVDEHENEVLTVNFRLEATRFLLSEPEPVKLDELTRDFNGILMMILSH